MVVLAVLALLLLAGLVYVIFGPSGGDDTVSSGKDNIAAIAEP